MKRPNIGATVFSTIMVAAGLVVFVEWQRAQPKASDVWFRAPTTTEDRATRRVIASQLAAFRANDFETAYSYESDYSPGIPTLLRFFKNRVNTIPIYHTYKSYRFGDIQSRTDGSQILATVLLTAKDGSGVQAFYTLERARGTYGIDGVSPYTVLPSAATVTAWRLPTASTAHGRRPAPAGSASMGLRGPGRDGSMVRANPPD